MWDFPGSWLYKKIFKKLGRIILLSLHKLFLKTATEMTKSFKIQRLFYIYPWGKCLKTDCNSQKEGEYAWVKHVRESTTLLRLCQDEWKSSLVSSFLPPLLTHLSVYMCIHAWCMWKRGRNLGSLQEQQMLLSTELMSCHILFKWALRI